MALRQKVSVHSAGIGCGSDVLIDIFSLKSNPKLPAKRFTDPVAIIRLVSSGGRDVVDVWSVGMRRTHCTVKGGEMSCWNSALISLTWLEISEGLQRCTCVKLKSSLKKSELAFYQKHFTNIPTLTWA